ncbi:MAG: DUF4389 domain-containing protein [Streptomycetaceae bacterium]|nr:DUF4389 domain-containing protein [Streptomycetaceae bacterium]
MNGTEAPAPHSVPARPVHPVRFEGDLESGLSRWLWLVKWLLLIPHLIVLVFLWIAVFLTSIVAWFAILFTARYPRGIFDFNVGVMRWSWRVQHYGYRALGTDRYPAFRLAAGSDDAARLEVAYPENLSRGKVLVKSWLLAIPHYLLIMAFGGWLSGLLALYAALSLLFTKRYPPGIFNLLLGLNRWAVRVVAYAALMTDVYPPFRLDQGGAEPAPAV